MSLDNGVLSDPEWKAAQTADGAYISTYAKSRPSQEDVAESFLAYFAARYVPSRISRSWETKIFRTIPNRIAYFDALLSADDMKPFRKVVSISIAMDTASVTEGGSATFTLTASPVPTSSITVNLTVADAPNADFLASSHQGGRKTVTIKANASSATYTVPTTGGADETTDEPNGPVTVTVNKGRGYSVGTTSTATVTVNDDDATTVTLAGASGNISEGGTKIFTVTLGRGLRKGESLDVPFTFAGTATRGATGDYTLSCASATGVTCPNLNTANARVTFTGSADDSATIVALTLSALSDGVTEPDGETVNINPGIATPTGLGGGAATPTGSLLFTINDPPPDPTVSFSSATYGGNEGSSVTVTMNITPTRASPTVLKVKTGGTAENTDYAEVNQTVTIAANASSATITVATTNDYLDDETLTLTLSDPPTGVNLGTPSSATVTITDDDTAGVTVSKNSLVIREGGTGGTYTVKLDSDPGGSVSISVSWDDTTAVTVSPETLAFDSSDWSRPKTLQVTAEQDRDTTDETVSVSHSVTGYGGITVPSVTVSVTDNDSTTDTVEEDVPVISISPAQSFVTEGGDAVFMLESTTAAPEDTEVSLTVSGTGDFFSHGQKGQKTAISAGGTSTEYKVPTLNDNDDEDDGSVTVTINAGGGYTVSTTAATATVTVMDDDLENPEDSSADRGTLVAIYKAAGGDGWKVGWNLDAPIDDWHGVKVDENSMVTGLYLSDNNLSGSIEDVLDEAEKLAGLRHLYLNDNVLTGEISSTRFSESGLAELALWGNSGLAGEVTGDLQKRVDRASLRALYEDNGGEDIDGWFPGEDADYFSYSGWEGVEQMDGRVVELNLSGLGLSEEITKAIAEISSLVALDLSDNPSLEGEIPVGLMELPSVTSLDISGTGVECPDDTAFRMWLESLIMFTDNGCYETKPAEQPAQAGGGCAVASGGLKEGAYQFVMVALALAAVAWGRGRN